MADSHCNESEYMDWLVGINQKDYSDCTKSGKWYRDSFRI